jgi:hypothetical protein
MIAEQELMAVTDRKERFELSMLYMQLHGMPASSPAGATASPFPPQDASQAIPAGQPVPQTENEDLPF